MKCGKVLIKGERRHPSKVGIPSKIRPTIEFIPGSRLERRKPRLKGPSLSYCQAKEERKPSP